MTVTIISTIIAGLAMVIAGVSLYMHSKRDNKQDVTQLTTVIVKLENIGNDIKEVKTDIREIKSDIKDHSERIARIEQEVKILNKTVFGKKSN